MTRWQRIISMLIACALPAALTACDRRPVDEPPVLKLGRDVCAECGMSVMEGRCSAAIIVERDDGRGYLIFDDIGCMLDHERAEPAPRPIARFVHDYTSGTWMAAEDATYLVCESIRTPMDSGVVAYAAVDAAREAQRQHGGVVRRWPELDTVRTQWLRDRQMPGKE